MAEKDKKVKSFDGFMPNKLSAEVLPRGIVSASVTSTPPTAETKTAAEIPAIRVLLDIIIQRSAGGGSGELLHGERVAYFTGGHVYKGSFVDGLMHGCGEYTWGDGVKYEGDFELNVPVGVGKYEWLDRSTYEGDVCNGIRHGTGTFKSSKTCTIYKGRWHKGKRHGKGDFELNVPVGVGKYEWLDRSTYEGDVCNGIRHGTGTFKSSKTCTIYKGRWHKGKRHGKGLMYFNEEATSWYEGDWENNRREGWGKRCYLSGDTYEGQWKNSVRHGEGTMKWIQLGQQYSGQWLNGVQHGHGKHTWFKRRIRGSQYPLRNEYTGTFAQGLRHGQGTFVYASGAVYTGSWKDNRKHGQGRFIFKNGRVYDGEFLDDHMVGFPASCTIPLHAPDGLTCSSEESKNSASLLGTDMALNIDNLLNRIPEAQRRHELRQVEFAIMRHISLLRSKYSVYSSLGHENSPDNTFLLSQLQFWRFLKDCSVHQHGLTLALLDRLINKDVSAGEAYSPFSSMLPREWISCIVIAAFHIYHRDFESSSCRLAECFSKLMAQNIIPNSKNVKGPLYCHPLRAAISKRYTERCWEIYQTVPKVIPAVTSDIMTARHFIWMFTLFNLFNSTLTTRTLLEILSVENPAIYSSTHINLNLEINFLEFFEALLSCAEVNTHGVSAVQGDWNDPDKTSKDQLKNSSVVSQSSSSQQDESTELSASTIISSAATSVKSIEEFDSRATTHSSLTEEIQYKEDKEGHAEEQLEGWVNRIHRFFTHTLFPAYEHNLLWEKEMQEKQKRQTADNRITLEKAKANAKLRDRQRVEAEKSKESEEILEETMQKDEEKNSSTALTTPVTSSNPVDLKQSPTNRKKKK